jgi:hypothetical protein
MTPESPSSEPTSEKRIPVVPRLGGAGLGYSSGAGGASLTVMGIQKARTLAMGPRRV